MSNFQNPKVPPTGGSHLPHAQPSSFEIQVELTTAAGLRRIRRLVATIGSGDCRMTWRRAGGNAAVDYFLFFNALAIANLICEIGGLNDRFWLCSRQHRGSALDRPN